MKILEYIETRRSAMAFKPEPISIERIKLLLDAASLAPSAYNEQPWRFYVARREKEVGFNRILSALAEPNQVWAKNASVLVATAFEPKLNRNNADNFHALHDLGLATSCMLIQAQSMGLVTHVMGGFNRETLRDNLSIPDSQEIGAVIAIGLPGNIDELPEKLRDRAISPRNRKTLDEVCRFV